MKGRLIAFCTVFIVIFVISGTVSADFFMPPIPPPGENDTITLPFPGPVPNLSEYPLSFSNSSLIIYCSLPNSSLLLPCPPINFSNPFAENEICILRHNFTCEPWKDNMSKCHGYWYMDCHPENDYPIPEFPTPVIGGLIALFGYLALGLKRLD